MTLAMRMLHARWTLLAIAASTGFAVAATPATQVPNRPASDRLEEVIVTSTPLGGLELSATQIPGNVQQADSREIEGVRSAGLAQMLNQKLGSVFINEAQTNPLQPDVQFRGFVASPLLGQPEGMSVYQDGVRINDPFGDIVSWALVPESAISSIDLIPGSNPVFGLNTLGGALSIHTKSGFTDTGTSAEVSGGSFGRVVAEAESGGNRDDRLSYYASARYLNEDGWRQNSPSEALHLFGKTGWRGSGSELDLAVTAVDTDLIGNGPAPVQLLQTDRNAVYTTPDRTQNSLTFVTLTGSHDFSAELRLEGVTYYRRSDIDSLNGDESHFAACDDAAGFICDDETGEVTRDPAGNPIPASDDLEGATLNRSKTDQETVGVTLQLGIAKPMWERANRLVIGGTADRSDVAFTSTTELGHLDDNRQAIGGGVFVGDSFVDLKVHLKNASLFFTDTFSFTQDVNLTIAGRYNDSSIALRDQLGTELSGDHSYDRFNSAAGVTWRVNPALQFYANYSESNRVPSPVELTCADEDAPCALPNAFLSDPPLEQIVAQTTEAGARGSLQNFSWHIGAFRTLNKDDILFISAGELTNRGFFDNVGDTRRQGIEVNLNGLVAQRVSWFLNYTLTDAQFLESFRVTSPHNPEAIDSEIQVERGARIPGIPEHLLKGGIRVSLGANASVTLDALHQSSQFYRGDEANVTAPLPGFTTVNAGAEWQINPHLMLFAHVENLFDENYATFGLFGAPDEVLGPGYDDPRFVSPAAPLSAWVGFRLTL